MSAFLVDTQIIGALAAYAVDNDLVRYGILYNKAFSDKNEVAKCLAQANIDSVNHRYPHHMDENSQREDRLYIDDCVAKANASSVKQSIGVIAKNVDCLDYQSCEPKEWYHSDAYKILTVIRANLTRQIPGYEQAQWG